MASLLAKRLDALDAVLGTGTVGLAIGRACPICGAHVALDDSGPCPDHQPLREAEQKLLVIFVAPND